MSDLANIDVEVLQDFDLLVTRPETGDRITYRKDGNAPFLVAMDSMRQDPDAARVASFSYRPGRPPTPRRRRSAGSNLETRAHSLSMAGASAARSATESQGAAAAAGPNSPPPGQALPGLVWAFHSPAGGAAEELALDRPLPDRSDGWLWLHFNLADARACRFLQGAAYVPAAARVLLIDAEEHQQLHAHDDCLYGVVADLVCGLEGVTEEIGFLHFAMTERLLVSGRRRALNGVEATRKALRGGAKIASVDRSSG